MIRLKKSYLALLLTFALIFSLAAVLSPAPAVNVCLAATPIRIAILPPIDKAKYNEPALNQFILSKVKERFLDPRHDLALNIQVENALNEITQGKKLTELPDKQFLYIVADKLSADVVVAVELTQASSTVFTSVFDEDIEMKNVEVSWAVYMKKDDKYVTYKSSKSDTTEPEYYRGIQRLTEDCMRDLIKKTVSTLKQNQLW